MFTECCKATWRNTWRNMAGKNSTPIAHCRNVRALGRASIENLNIKTEMLWMKSYPTKSKSFLWKIVQMGTLQKLQNSIQTLIIFWPNCNRGQLFRPFWVFFTDPTWRRQHFCLRRVLCIFVSIVNSQVEGTRQVCCLVSKECRIATKETF